jgi:hypothetical protein
VEKDELKQKIMEDEDFIKAPKYANSLNRFLAKNERKLDNGAIGRLLLITEEEVDQLYEQSIVELRKEMVDGEDGEGSRE